MSEFFKNNLYHFLNNSRSIIAIELGFSPLERASERISIYIKFIRLKEVIHGCFQSETFFIVYYESYIDRRYDGKGKKEKYRKG